MMLLVSAFLSIPFSGITHIAINTINPIKVVLAIFKAFFSLSFKFLKLSSSLDILELFS
ncbi:hypothetical protein SDC9_165517 [bioreactor metagenome]|uniref:Uncharacterized protein n=1 Tax=bioreactor metagenome TaxID=1076179 RepID=A0A645FX23_9ZZZZ